MDIINKIIIFILLIMMLPTVSALDPIELGSGKINRIINLDVGPKNATNMPYFGAQGFVAPSIPQFAQLSPGAMVYQSKKYRDETSKLYADACAIFSRTLALGESASKSSKEAATHENEARLSANSSASNALLCVAYLNKTISIYSQNQALGQETETMAKNVAEMENRTREYANQATCSAQLTGASINDTGSCKLNISLLMQKMELLEKRVSGLEAIENHHL